MVLCDMINARRMPRRGFSKGYAGVGKESIG
jgi:hypothetical protein